MKIRPEDPADVEQIRHVIMAAFKEHSHSNQKEHYLVDDLRRKNALTASFVAETDNQIIGHIAFSKVNIDGKDLSWYGLAPVSVIPEYQNKGIGSQLINTGITAIKKIGGRGCVLLGEPEYYKRFGFKPNTALTLPDVPEEYFLILPFDSKIPAGNAEYHAAFSANI